MIRKPNVLLIIMDSVRAANLSCYGYERQTTPFIDKLAEEGTLYERAYSVGCWTLPVHTSLFTGLYPKAHGVKISQDALPSGVTTLAASLQAAGYQTASFSSNPYISAGTGLTQGFDTVADLWSEIKPYGFRRTKISRVLKKLESFGWLAKPIAWPLRQLQSARSVFKRIRSQGDKGAGRTNQKVCSWLTESRDTQKPFFLFLNYMEVHEPYNAPAPFKRKFVPRYVSNWRVAQIESLKKSITRRDHESLEILRGLYDGELAYLDRVIENLVALLARLGELERTVVIITADHGDSLGEHNHIGHRVELYDELLHIPLILHYPARFTPGSRVQEKTSLVDLYPTILELAGIQDPPSAHPDFFSLLSKPYNGRRPFLFAENTAPESYAGVLSRVIRSDHYKLIWKSNQQHELYSLDRDRMELENLIEVEPQIAQQMQVELEAWVRLQEQNGHPENRSTLDESVLSRLRDLGYVE